MALFTKRKPAFQLVGLATSPEGLYDGSFVAACAQWWNHEVQERRQLQADGHRPLTVEEIRKLGAVVQPENRHVLEAVASSVSMPGRQSAAVLALAYAFALVIDAAASQTRDAADTHASWTQAPQFTDHDLTELMRHYNEEGRAGEYEIWAPYWMAAVTAFGDRVGNKLIGSLQATFDNQVDRWSAAEGFDLRRSIGAPDYSLIAFDDNAGLPNFVELLFEWGGRLRLGERFLADGIGLADERFAFDEFDPIDHFYAEAYERYIALASHDEPPISPEVEMAARMCTAWLGDELDQQRRLAISTTAIRAYLWRTVEKGPVDFLEPDLTDAVRRSFEVGDDRTDEEPLGVTYYYAASQCMVENVRTRLGSIGGLIQGPRSYERAFWDTTDDFEDRGVNLNENTRRLAFNFGICLADVERVLKSGAATREI